jgi:hypothetical protein
MRDRGWLPFFSRRASIAMGMTPLAGLRVEVQDTRLGMSREAQVRLFEKF